MYLDFELSQKSVQNLFRNVSLNGAHGFNTFGGLRAFRPKQFLPYTRIHDGPLSMLLGFSCFLQVYSPMDKTVSIDPSSRKGAFQDIDVKKLVASFNAASAISWW